MIERRQLREDTRSIQTLGIGATYTRGFTEIFLQFGSIIQYGVVLKNKP